MNTKSSNVLIAITVCLAVFAGCAPALNQVNRDVLASNQNKPFHIGTVKVAECAPPFHDDVIKKTEALNNIHIDKIIDVLQSKYKLEISRTINKEVKVVKEKAGGQTAPSSTPNAGVSVRLMFTCDNPYYGNLEYTKNDALKSLFGVDPELKRSDIDRTINVLYFYNVIPFVFNVDYSYIVSAYAGEDLVFQHSGNVAAISAPMKGLFINYDGIMNEMIRYAPEIAQALVKDIDAYNAYSVK